MQVCVMKRTIVGRILIFARTLSDILLLKLTLLEVIVVKHYFTSFCRITLLHQFIVLRTKVIVTVRPNVGTNIYIYVDLAR
jgi:hypothetical protein